MGFATDTKNEIASLSFQGHKDMIFELSGFTRTNATISISFMDKVSMYFSTESSAIARRLFKLVKNLYSYEAPLAVQRDDKFKKNLYLITIEDEDVTRFILEDVRIRLGDFFEIKFDLVEGEMDLEAKQSFLRGAFLGAGSVMDPQKGYHLEIRLEAEETASFIRNLSFDLGLEGSIYQRRGYHVFYFKDSETISDFLANIGATNAKLKIEDLKVLRDVKNKVNRMVNAETANITKTVNAAIKQIEAINLIEEKKGLETLPSSLEEIARLRLEFPDDSLKNLGNRLSEPLSKSGVNHRLKKIMEIARGLDPDYS